MEDNNNVLSNSGEIKKDKLKIVLGGVLFLVLLTFVLLNKDVKPNLEAFYYTLNYLDRNPDDRAIEYKFFKVSPYFDKPDVSIGSFSEDSGDLWIIADSWKDKTVLLIKKTGDEREISSLNVSSKNYKPNLLVKIPGKEDSGEISDVRFLNKGKGLAFITYDGLEIAKNSYLNIVSLSDTKNIQKYSLSKESPMYSTFGFLAESKDKIYLDESGGDGGGVWSSWYKFNKTTKKISKMENMPPSSKNEWSPVVTKFSPDGNRLAYTDFSTSIDTEDLDSPDTTSQGGSIVCLKFFGSNVMQKYEPEGGTVMIKNLETGAISEIFRNLSYSDNTCKNIARRIIDVKWLDDSNIAFETIDGVYSININTKEKKEVFSFGNVNNPGAQVRPSIVSIQLPFIVFSDSSIVNVNTGKYLQTIESEDGARYVFSFK